MTNPNTPLSFFHKQHQHANMKLLERMAQLRARGPAGTAMAPWVQTAAAPLAAK